MSLKWVRLDTAFPRNHKVLALLGGQKDGHRAAFVYLCGLSYCGEQGTDGFIPKEALMWLHGRPADARSLVSVGLWREDVGGWLIDGWAEYQPSSTEMETKRKRAQAAAARRWTDPEPSS